MLTAIAVSMQTRYSPRLRGSCLQSREAGNSRPRKTSSRSGGTNSLSPSPCGRRVLDGHTTKHPSAFEGKGTWLSLAQAPVLSHVKDARNVNSSPSQTRELCLMMESSKAGETKTAKQLQKDRREGGTPKRHNNYSKRSWAVERGKLPSETPQAPADSGNPAKRSFQ